MQHDRLGIGERQQIGVDLIGAEGRPPITSVVLLAHRHPGVGHEYIGPGHGHLRVDDNLDASAGECRSVPRVADKPFVGRKSLRCTDFDVHSRRHTAEHQRMGHVVRAVPEVGERETRSMTFVFDDRL